MRPEQPEPYLRGCLFGALETVPYPRVNPADAGRVTRDVWDSGTVPVGVRIELVGDARTIRIWYTTTTANLGYRGDAAGCAFVAYRAGQKVAEAEAVLGPGMVELDLPGDPNMPVTVYLPEGMRPIVTGVAGVDAAMGPAPSQARWLAYGDATTQGWLASTPAMAWPSVVARKLGLDLCNLGYAGSAHGEIPSAKLLADTPAEVISIAFGANCWSRVPHTAGLMRERVRAFLSLVRHDHPMTPVIVVSPTLRPDAEETPNRVGATLAELRHAMEDAVNHRRSEGDKGLVLVEGLTVVEEDDLEDGVYPGDEGHRRLAAAVSKHLNKSILDIRAEAEHRWDAERAGSVGELMSVGEPEVSSRTQTSQRAPRRPVHARTAP
jgi:lysophospholipase L1-like esterase